MAGMTSRMLFPVMLLFLISTIPISQADANDRETESRLDFSVDSTIKSVYLQNEIIEVTMALSNLGDEVVFTNDPSCDYYFEIYNDLEEQIYSTQSQCRGQAQTKSIDAKSTEILQTKTWDFIVENGSYIESGNYELRLLHSSLPLEETIELYYQQKSGLEDGLEYQLNNIDNTILVSLSNPTNAIVYPSSDYCTIAISIENSSSAHRLCNETTDIIYPNQNIEIGYISIDTSTLKNGYNEVIISDTEAKFSTALRLDYARLDYEIDYHEMGLNLELDVEKKFNVDRIPFLQMTPQINNNIDLNLLVVTNNSCIVHNKVFNTRGVIIHDSYSDLCQPNGLTVVINADDKLPLPAMIMPLLDQNNCYIDSGNYIISTQVMGTNLHYTTNYYFDNVYQTQNCNNDNIDSTASVELNGNRLEYTIELIFKNPTAIVSNPCIVNVEMRNEDKTETLVEHSFCEFKSGDYFVKTIDNDNLKLSGSFPVNLTTLRENNKSIIFHVNFEGSKVVKINLPSPQESIESVDSKQVFDLQGEWSLIKVEGYECWTLLSGDSAHVVDITKYQRAWAPKQNWQGHYSVVSIENSQNSCDDLSIPAVELVAIHSESNPVEQQVTAINEQVDDEPFITPVRVTIAITTTSLLAGLVLLISQTESLRIPATSASLWLLALVGKTHETSDGRFQRGRLIGYLTANPGCHFRALMAALKMSNGQITHHLRLLENQELIWRLNDGRFVRYYPLNNSLYPGMDSSELPIPQLSPDPNSLQGKILTILDDEHQIGEFPTQAELAKKLEKSQQLISHHLRTLQKYGLVEKRKMGIKNRYKLTKEAIFLLETDIDYLKVRN